MDRTEAEPVGWVSGWSSASDRQEGVRRGGLEQDAAGGVPECEEQGLLMARGGAGGLPHSALGHSAAVVTGVQVPPGAEITAMKASSPERPPGKWN